MRKTATRLQPLGRRDLCREQIAAVVAGTFCRTEPLVTDQPIVCHANCVLDNDVCDCFDGVLVGKHAQGGGWWIMRDSTGVESLVHDQELMPNTNRSDRA